MAISEKSIKEMKELRNFARKNGIKEIPISEAWRMFSVEKEVHKGKIEYWTGGEGE